MISKEHFIVLYIQDTSKSQYSIIRKQTTQVKTCKRLKHFIKEDVQLASKYARSMFINILSHKKIKSQIKNYIERKQNKIKLICEEMVLPLCIIVTK